MKALLLALCLLPLALPAQPAVAPRIRSVAQGIELSVECDGTPPFTYQWRMGVSVKLPVIGGTGRILLLTPPYAAKVGLYDVVITNSAGTTTSAPVRLSVTTQPDAPAIQITIKEPKPL